MSFKQALATLAAIGASGVVGWLVGVLCLLLLFIPAAAEAQVCRAYCGQFGGTAVAIHTYDKPSVNNDKPGTVFLTVDHLIKNGGRVSVSWGGERHAGRVVKRWNGSNQDMALIYTPGLIAKRLLPLRDVKPTEGETGTIYGYPYYNSQKLASTKNCKVYGLRGTYFTTDCLPDSGYSGGAFVQEIDGKHYTSGVVTGFLKGSRRGCMDYVVPVQRYLRGFDARCGCPIGTRRRPAPTNPPPVTFPPTNPPPPVEVPAPPSDHAERIADLERRMSSVERQLLEITEKLKVLGRLNLTLKEMRAEGEAKVQELEDRIKALEERKVHVGLLSGPEGEEVITSVVSGTATADDPLELPPVRMQYRLGTLKQTQSKALGDYIKMANQNIKLEDLLKKLEENSASEN